ncbi:MAG: hypothetical protein ACYDAK_12810 [Candidatus Limnocylindrales bacterium]
MAPPKKNNVATFALAMNLAISGATLTYVRDTEHRISLLEAHMSDLAAQQAEQQREILHSMPR